MVINVRPELEAVLREVSQQQGITPEDLVLIALHERFLPSAKAIEPQDEWDRRLLAGVMNCGGSILNSALRREELYD
jgi:hypothetical protein